MDRLIALVGLRFRLEGRAALGRRSRRLLLLVGLPALFLFSLCTAIVSYALARFVERADPALTLPVVSAVAAAFGLSWSLAPLVAGMRTTETHDLDRLLHYPVPLATLVGASLLASAAQPVVLAQLPPLLTLALGLAGPGPRWPITAVGLLLSLALMLACGQGVGLVLHAVSRHRRWHDRAVFAGIGLAILVSFLPILLLSGGARASRGVLLSLLRSDVSVLVPFSWGARAAVHASRGEAGPFLAWAGAATLALAFAVSLSVLLARQLYRGELDLGEARGGVRRRARMPLPGGLGALVEKDLRVAWRDPRLKATVFTGFVGPLVVLLALAQGAGSALPPGLVLGLASFAGLGVLGANVFAFEGRGLGLLLGAPTSRLSILAAKNAATLVLRLPALLMVAVAALFVSGASLVPAAVVVVLVTELAAAAVDNYVSILAPLRVPAAGRDPSGSVSGMRGLGAAFVSFAAMAAALALSSPFTFLAWLPHLLDERWLWLLTLPTALAGAGAVYFMLASFAARLLSQREPELVARVAGDD